VMQDFFIYYKNQDFRCYPVKLFKSCNLIYPCKIKDMVKFSFDYSLVNPIELEHIYKYFVEEEEILP
jgi:hypothetical protein